MQHTEETILPLLSRKTNALMIWSALIGVVGVVSFMVLYATLVYPEWLRFAESSTEDDGYMHGNYTRASSLEVCLIGGTFGLLMLIAGVALLFASRRLYLFKRHHAPQKLQAAMNVYSIFWVCWAIAGLIIVALTLWEKALFRWLEASL